MIDESLRNKIIWLDQNLNTAQNSIQNIETYIRYKYADRLAMKDNEVLLDDKQINLNLLTAKIEEQIKADLNITKAKQNIKLVIKSIASENPIIETNIENDNVISDKYIDEFKNIQENIDNWKTHLSSIIEDIKEMPDDDWDIYKKWKDEKCMYIRNKDGVITGVDMCYNNIVNWLDNFPITKNKVKWNNIRNIVTFNNKQLTDTVLHEIMQMINKYLSKDFSNLKGLYDAITGCAIKNKYNTWVDYFNGLNYIDDGIDYIDYTIKNVLCCEEQEKYYDLYYETLKIMCLAVMSRIYNKELYNKPIKFDTVTVFCSENGGTGKTTFPERLFDINDDGNSYCYVVAGDSFQPSNKDFIERSHQCTCLLLDELSMARAKVTSVKGYITQRDDIFRKSYGYNNESHIRGFIIIATSNNNDILKDYTTANERRWAIVKVSEDPNNYKKVNDAFDNGFRDKLWAFIKNIYLNEEYKLYMTDERLIELETQIQRGYKASNNEDYNTIIHDLLEREYGFYDEHYVNVDLIVNQYRSDNSYDWCCKYNEEFEAKKSKSLKGEYIMKPDDRKIVYWGKIDRIQKTVLYNILDKLGIDYTKPSLAAEMRDSGIWNGYGNNRPCKINGKTTMAYWRINKTSRSIIEFNHDEGEKQSILPF